MLKQEVKCPECKKTTIKLDENRKGQCQKKDCRVEVSLSKKNDKMLVKSKEEGLKYYSAYVVEIG